jgi:hypothetical protein
MRNKTDILLANEPGEKFFNVIFEEDFSLSNHPAFFRHLEAKEEQTTVIRCHVNRLFVIESQELISAIKDELQ